MEHQIIVLNTEVKGIPKGTKGTIVFDYGRDVYEVEFLVNGKSVTETISEWMILEHIKS